MDTSVDKAGNKPVKGTAQALAQEFEGKRLEATVFGYATPTDLQKPKGIHRMMSMVHAVSLDEYLAEVRAAVAQVRSEGAGTSKLLATY